MENPTRIAPELATALNNRGYKSLTPIQEAIIKNEIKGKDAIVSAQTGSGKTIAFGLYVSSVLLRKIEKSKIRLPQVLIIAPTRELALQVRAELEWLYAKTKVSIASCVGGMDISRERRDLARRPEIILGTPGRLKDHIEKGSLDLSIVEIAVLDEADEMLKLGFREEIEFILGNTPKTKNTLMFSATISKKVEKLATRYQKKPLRISTINENEQHLDIQYKSIIVAPQGNEHAIMNILRYYDAKNALVFCSTRANVNHLTNRLHNRGFSVVALSGELTQKERINALRSMRDGRSKVCVATDVAARGIDLPNLELVIHADLPKNKESLLHRSGRTGRAGKKGVSILIVGSNIKRKAQRLLDNTQITPDWETPPTPQDILRRDNERLLNSPLLEKIPSDDEKNLIAIMLKRHSPEKIAFAFIQNFKRNKYAPDEIMQVNKESQKGSDLKSFNKGIWFNISAGSDQNLKPNWLIQNLLTKSRINKKDIGAIKIEKNNTILELNFKAAKILIQSLGNNNELKKDVHITLLDNINPNTSSDISISLTGNSKQRRKLKRANERKNRIQ